MIEASTVTSGDEFARLRPEWDRLLVRCPGHGVFQTHPWLSVWWEHFGTKGNLCLVLLRDDRELLGVLPFCMGETSLLGRTVRFARPLANDHTPLFDLILAPGRERELLEAGLAVLFETWGCAWAELRSVPADAPWLSSLPGGGGAALEFEKASPYIEVTGTWGEYFQGLSKQFRANLGKASRQLERLHGLDHARIGLDPDHGTLRELLKLEASSWKGEAGSAIQSSPALSAFYEHLAAVMEREGWLLFQTVRGGGKTLAADLCLVYGGETSILKGGYRSDYAKYSLGQLMHQAVIRGCFEGDGIRRCNLLGASDAYKLRWTDKTRELLTVHLFQPTILGRAVYQARFGIKDRLRRNSAARWLKERITRMGRGGGA